MFGGDYKFPNMPVVPWSNGSDSVRLDEAEHLLAYIYDELNDIPDEDVISNENYMMIQRILGRLEQFLNV